MEISIIGPGEVVIRFIDSKGETLVQETVVVSGSPTVEGRRTIDLSVRTADGQRPLAPVLVRQGNSKQRVMFDGDTPSRFTQKRCKEIGCTVKVAKAAASGQATPPRQGAASVRLSDDHALAKLIKTAGNMARRQEKGR